MTLPSEPVDTAGSRNRRTVEKSALTIEGQRLAIADPVEAVLARLQSARCAPKLVAMETWRSLCPAHKDCNPSLSVSRGDDGRALIHCFAGCSGTDIMSALGMALAELFVRRDDRARRPHQADACSLQESVEQWVPLIGLDPKYWLYHDAQGVEIFAVARYRGRTGNKEIRPFRRGEDGSWKLGRPPGKLPPYRLAEIIPAARVVIVEGEKCADLARRIGLCATTSAFGAGSANKTDWSPLAGKDVVIVPDEDEAGERYARDVARALDQLNPSALVLILRLPGLAEGEGIEQ